MTCKPLQSGWHRFLLSLYGFYFFVVNGAQITPRMLTFVKKLVSTFGIGFESGSSVYSAFSTSASESLARRAQATAQDPVFVKLKEQFVEDFDIGLVLFLSTMLIKCFLIVEIDNF